MNENEEMLSLKASLGQLDPSEKERWESMCREEPRLRKEAEGVAGVAKDLNARVRNAEDSVEVPEAVPPEILNRLEQARASVFGDLAEKTEIRQEHQSSQPGAWQLFTEWLREILGPAGPVMAAAAAAVAILAVGWWGMKGDRVGQPILKSLAVSPELPFATPGEITRLTDPPVTWVTLDPAPVTVTVSSADGASVLYQGNDVRPPVAFDQLSPESGGAAELEPGESYLFRIERGEIRSERLVQLHSEARSLDSWVAEGPDAGRSRVEGWLREGNPSDALALAAALAKTYSDQREAFSPLRAEALKAALEENPGE